MGCMLQQLEVCLSLWRVNSDCVITLSARGGRQMLRTDKICVEQTLEPILAIRENVSEVSHKRLSAWLHGEYVPSLF